MRGSLGACGRAWARGCPARRLSPRPAALPFGWVFPVRVGAFWTKGSGPSTALVPRAREANPRRVCDSGQTCRHRKTPGPRALPTTQRKQKLVPETRFIPSARPRRGPSREGAARRPGGGDSRAAPQLAAPPSGTGGGRGRRGAGSALTSRRGGLGTALRRAAGGQQRGAQHRRGQQQRGQRPASARRPAHAARRRRRLGRRSSAAAAALPGPALLRATRPRARHRLPPGCRHHRRRLTHRGGGGKAGAGGGAAGGGGSRACPRVGRGRQLPAPADPSTGRSRGALPARSALWCCRPAAAAPQSVATPLSNILLNSWVLSFTIQTGVSVPWPQFWKCHGKQDRQSPSPPRRSPSRGTDAPPKPPWGTTSLMLFVSLGCKVRGARAR